MNNKKEILLTCLAAISASFCTAQISCADAPYQLSQYVSNVNAFANNELYYNIPARCGGNAWCMSQQKSYLDQWYMQQAYAVRQCYETIVRTCTYQQPRRLPTPGPGKPIEIDDVAVEDSKADEDVAISIPTDPVGYKTTPKVGHRKRSSSY